MADHSLIQKDVWYSIEVRQEQGGKKFEPCMIRVRQVPSLDEQLLVLSVAAVDYEPDVTLTPIKFQGADPPCEDEPALP